MAYVPVPKDLSKVKTKVAFNLTKRQIVCFAAALLFGLPLFFLLKDSTGTSLASMAMIAVMLPCFLFAMYEKHGQPLEVVVKNIIQTKFIAPKERPYYILLFPFLLGYVYVVLSVSQNNSYIYMLTTSCFCI